MVRFYKPELIKYYVLISLSLSGTILVLLSTSLTGASITPDSVHYISAARNFVSGNGLIAFDGSPLVLWPPLYPVILSIPDLLFSIDPLISASIINAVFFGLIVYFSGLLIFRHLKSSVIVQILGSTIILLSLILLDTATHAWSEIVFIFFIQVFFYYLEKYRERHDTITLLMLSLSVALACLTRYIGVCLIITGAIMLFSLYVKNLKSGVLPILLFILISSLPIGIFLVRNYFISDSLFGSRNPSTVTVFQNLVYVFNAIRDYGYFPVKVIKSNALFLFVILFSIIAACSGKQRFRQTSPVILFILFYVAFLVYSSSTYAYEQINARYLSPLYIPATLLFLVSLEILLEPIKKILSPVIVNTLFGLGLFLWLISYPLKGTQHYVSLWKNHGTGGFNSPEWNKSDLIQRIRNIQLQQGQSIYSSEGSTIYILTGIVCKNTYPVLSKEPINIPDENDLAELCLANSYDYYIWFNDYSNLFKWDELISSTNVRKLDEYKEGVVFAIFRVP